MEYKSFLIKYVEIGVKGKNRYLFENALVQQIKYALKRIDGDFHVHKAEGRVYVDASGDYDYDEVIDNLRTVFGISGICPMIFAEDEGFTVWNSMRCLERRYLMPCPHLRLMCITRISLCLWK